MGLPEIDIRFEQDAVTAIDRSQQGIVAVILKDDTDTSFSMVEYFDITEIEEAKFTAENVEILKDAFKVPINKLIVVRIGDLDPLSDATDILKNKLFDWCCIVSDTQADHDDLVSYIVTRNQTYSKRAKCLAYKASSADDKHIVNFTNDHVTRSGETETTLGHQYILRLTALFAYLSIDQSGTYYELQDLDSVSDITDPDTAIDNGELILINDEEKIRIARAVNSLTTLGENDTEDMKYILIIEAMDLIYYDIHDNYKENFLGEYKNSYDNQALFLVAVNSYFRSLAKQNVLDPNYTNRAFIDVEAQRDALIADGTTEASDWTEQEVKNHAFKNKIFLSGNIKILNAMEDLIFGIKVA